ncbi:hypothetical protein GCM10027598_76940 [Amycolatopsis oliviviridis]|uniref:Uncharacterized protein n=1 Tax=Amycolatopsis oliviviridis TaxID=1471590 RepID=A0ABQ3L4L4_9PSEU|nr:hypothetical protein [Amycolatopsis oliviviridis]GHH04285.1 hypothetical protein GCM10017790_06880 [Amycolatopsis oliviviridis]
MTGEVHADLRVPGWSEPSGLMAAAHLVAVAGTDDLTRVPESMIEI